MYPGTQSNSIGLAKGESDLQNQPLPRSFTRSRILCLFLILFWLVFYIIGILSLDKENNNNKDSNKNKAAPKIKIDSLDLRLVLND